MTQGASIDYSGLNPEQYEGVFSDKPRILCLAGAGTGKTQVLTRRIGRLWEGGVKTGNMLALTFTRAAGAEMKERVVGLIGGDGRSLFCNTFHAFCAELIRRGAALSGRDSAFSVYDESECDEIMRSVIGDLRYKISVKAMKAVWAGKTEGITVSVREQAKRALKEYAYRLKRSNAFDFDGLVETVGLAAKNNPSLRDELRARYKYVFVDEFQDTDAAQWELINLIDPENLFVVGDDFQSIYAFRGGDIGIILKLAGDSAWHTVKLERNYRSTVPITAAANALIKHNRQTDKSLFTSKTGPAVDYREASDCHTEITDIAGRLVRNRAEGKTTAILSRFNFHLSLAEDILRARGIACENSAAAVNPYTAKAGRVLLAWLGAFVNPMDDAAFKTAASSYPGFGKAAIHEAEKAQLSGGGGYSQALASTASGARFMDYFGIQREAFFAMPDVAAGLRALSAALGIKDMSLAAEAARWQNEQRKLGEMPDAESLLRHAGLAGRTEQPPKERGSDKAYLMTIHGSKGLEFDEVFIIGVAQGFLPNGSSDINEERRLFYVAMTRAREYLNVSRPLLITEYGGRQRETERSQFISEALLCVPQNHPLV